MATNEVRQLSHAMDAWVEPIDAMERLREFDALLLDGMGEHPEARFAYAALSAHVELRFRDGAWSLTHADGRCEQRPGNPQDVLRQLLSEYRFHSSGGGFTGGFVGYFGYEFARVLEPTLPAPKTAAATPDAVLRLCRDVVRFDRAKRIVTVFTNDLPGETDAMNRRDSIVSALGGDATAGNFTGMDVAWTTSMDETSFCAAVEHLQELIADGDLFQANIATRFTAPLEVDVRALYAAVQRANPSPFMALLDWGDHVVLSNSPEQLFAVDEGVIRSRPIAGTRPRGVDASDDEALEHELLHDAKEQAEHTMLVDLVRNDVARVASPGTVRVPERGSIERYQRVMHLVSCVEGRVRPGTDFVDWLAALFPGGTITGAPKHRACLRIHEAEPVPRGPYTGSAGFLSWDQQTTHWNIMIRTMVLQDGVAAVHAGSGIVRASVPEREWQEAGHKAASLMSAAAGAAASHGDIGRVTKHAEWNPAPIVAQVDARVLLVDNYDSFVHNLSDLCAALGASVEVVRNDADVDAAMKRLRPTHVILGPGPGWPADAGATKQLAQSLPGQLPVLGVCLGHQALAEAAGATVEVAREPIHGESEPIHHDGEGLEAGLASPFAGARYHSLVVREETLPADWRVTARLADGTMMSMRHREHAAFGLQYHPESIGTQHGLDILIQFLRSR